MKDTANSTPVNLEASEPRPAVAAQRARQPVPRYIYVMMRLEEIGVNIIALAKEREKLTSDLQAPPNIDGPTHKQLRQRRAFVAERIDILRMEQADLNCEKKAMGPAGQSVGGQQKIMLPSGGRTTFN